MQRRSILLASIGSTLVPKSFAQEIIPARSARTVTDWARLFEAADVPGTLVVLDERTTQPATHVHDPARAGQRFTPASTFKIPHTLFALDAGLVRDEFEVFAWDGKQRSVPAWNRDQTLRSAVRDSAVWVFERFAQQLGTAREEAYMKRIAYGNCLATGASPFWVEGDLAISAHEQVAMLRALYRNELPFRIDHQRLVKDVLVAEAGTHWILRAKSGWSGRIGWWTGWVEFAQGPVFFAINIDTPRRQADLPKRISIVREAMRSLDAWPAA